MPRRTKTTRRRPVTAALLQLNQAWRLWASLPPGVTHINVMAGDANDVAEVVGTATRPRRFPKGICERCGCSEFDPCFTPIGTCGWVDRRERLCTSCVAP